MMVEPQVKTVGDEGKGLRREKPALSGYLGLAVTAYLIKSSQQTKD